LYKKEKKLERKYKKDKITKIQAAPRKVERNSHEGEDLYSKSVCFFKKKGNF